MKQAQLVSSNLRSATWDQGALVVEFNRGATYTYHDVPEKVFDDLVAAESAGSFFAKNIRDVYSHSGPLTSGADTPVTS